VDHRLKERDLFEDAYDHHGRRNAGRDADNLRRCIFAGWIVKRLNRHRQVFYSCSKKQDDLEDAQDRHEAAQDDIDKPERLGH
jgi:hypothetical protein